MEVYPAIDLMKGRAVRLYKGRKESVKVYGDPLKIAGKFAELVDKIHIVDLDGAFEGTPRNLDVVEAIVRETGLRVQIGGGFRTYEVVEKAYEIGVENVILGTKALDTSFLKKLAEDFDGVTVSLDVKNGRIALKGWVEEDSMRVEDAFEILRNYVKRFVYTSIERDGTLTGVDEIERFWGKEEFIYAGGVSSVQDVVKLADRGFSGVIVGKALYEGMVTLEELLEAARCSRKG